MDPGRRLAAGVFFMLPEIATFQKRLGDVQADLRTRRAAAFVDYAPEICGLKLRPVTLKTYTQLVAFGNGFVTGTHAGFKDIFQFCWIHHPEFGQFADEARLRVLAQVHAGLTPRRPQLNAVLAVVHPILMAAIARGQWAKLLIPFAWGCKKLREPSSAELTATAVVEIRRVLTEALQDFPIPGDDATPLPYSQKPLLVALITRAYPIDFATASQLVDEMPLKQLVEYLREMLHRLSNGKDKLLTREEAAVWSDYLAFKTAQEAGAN